MLSIIEGDLFTSELPVLGHGVNTAGVMGAGIAREFRRRYPAMYSAYRSACHQGKLQPGHSLVLPVTASRWVANMASQDKLGRHARAEWLRRSLSETLEWMTASELRGIAIPMIGSGIGGLEDYETVQTITEVAQLHPGIELHLYQLPSRTRRQ